MIEQRSLIDVARELFANSDVCVALIDEQLRIVTANPAFATLFGFAPGELEGSLVTDRSLQEDRPTARRLSADVFAARRDHFQLDTRCLRKDGTVMWVELAVSCVRGDSGQVELMLLVVDDITGRRIGGSQFRAVFEATDDGILLIDTDSGLILEANPAACAIFGYERDDLVGLAAETLIHPDGVEAWQRQRHSSERVRLPLLGLRKDGSAIQLELHETTMIVRGRTTTVGVFHDITEQAHAFAQLEERVTERTRELSALLDVSRALSRTLELRPLLSLLLDRLVSVVRYTEAFVMLEQDSDICVYEYRGRQDREHVITIRGPIERAPVYQMVLRERGPIIIDDLQGDSLRARQWRATGGPQSDTRGLSSVLAVPLAVKGRVIGQIRLDHAQPGFYGPEHAELAVAIANQAAVAIDNARLFEDERAARERLEVALAVGRMGTWEWDLATGRVTWSPQLEAIHGLPQGTFGGTFEAYLADIHPDDRAYVQEAVRRSLESGDHHIEYRIVWPDGSVHWLAASGRVVKDAQGRAVGMRGVCQDVTARKLAFEARAALEERQRLARELHDSVSQALYGIALGAQTIASALTEDTDIRAAREATDYVLHLAEAAITEMRALIFELRPESLEQEGLVAALERHADSLRARHGLRLELQLGDEPDLSLEQKEALYRITIEALQNTIKHAHATLIRIRLVREADSIVLEISDDGAGFDAGQSYPGHLGLTSMRERAQLIGASFTIESTPGSGTRLSARLPLR